VERLTSTATVLGLFVEWECVVEERQLFAGDVLVLYTDGVTESSNDAGEEFGEERAAKVLTRNRGKAPGAMIEAVVEEVRKFRVGEQQDDITLIVAKCS